MTSIRVERPPSHEHIQPVVDLKEEMCWMEEHIDQLSSLFPSDVERGHPFRLIDLENTALKQQDIMQVADDFRLDLSRKRRLGLSIINAEQKLEVCGKPPLYYANGEATGVVTTSDVENAVSPTSLVLSKATSVGGHETPRVEIVLHNIPDTVNSEVARILHIQALTRELATLLVSRCYSDRHLLLRMPNREVYKGTDFINLFADVAKGYSPMSAHHPYPRNEGEEFENFDAKVQELIDCVTAYQLKFVFCEDENRCLEPFQGRQEIETIINQFLLAKEVIRVSSAHLTRIRIGDTWLFSYNEHDDKVVRPVGGAMERDPLAGEWSLVGFQSQGDGNDIRGTIPVENVDPWNDLMRRSSVIQEADPGREIHEEIGKGAGLTADEILKGMDMNMRGTVFEQTTSASGVLTQYYFGIWDVKIRDPAIEQKIIKAAEDGDVPFCLLTTGQIQNWITNGINPMIQTKEGGLTEVFMAPTIRHVFEERISPRTVHRKEKHKWMMHDIVARVDNFIDRATPHSPHSLSQEDFDMLRQFCDSSELTEVESRLRFQRVQLVFYRYLIKLGAEYSAVFLSQNVQSLIQLVPLMLAYSVLIASNSASNQASDDAYRIIDKELRDILHKDVAPSLRYDRIPYLSERIGSICSALAQAEKQGAPTAGDLLSGGAIGAAFAAQGRPELAAATAACVGIGEIMAHRMLKEELRMPEQAKQIYSWLTRAIQHPRTVESLLRTATPAIAILASVFHYNPQQLLSIIVGSNIVSNSLADHISSTGDIAAGIHGREELRVLLDSAVFSTLPPQLYENHCREIRLREDAGPQYEITYNRQTASDKRGNTNATSPEYQVRRYHLLDEAERRIYPETVPNVTKVTFDPETHDTQDDVVAFYRDHFGQYQQTELERRPKNLVTVRGLTLPVPGQKNVILAENMNLDLGEGLHVMYRGDDSSKLLMAAMAGEVTHPEGTVLQRTAQGDFNQHELTREERQKFVYFIDHTSMDSASLPSIDPDVYLNSGIMTVEDVDKYQRGSTSGANYRLRMALCLALEQNDSPWVLIHMDPRNNPGTNEVQEIIQFLLEQSKNRIVCVGFSDNARDCALRLQDLKGIDVPVGVNIHRYSVRPRGIEEGYEPVHGQ